MAEVLIPNAQITDGCYVATWTFQAANDRRDANIDIADLDGMHVQHFENAVLVGWAPGS